MTSNFLKVERVKHGWTQAKVAEAVGVDAKTVGRWERGKALPYPYYREQLCLLFGKTAQQLGLSSTDEKDFLQDATSLDIQSPEPDTAVPVSFLADLTIPYYLEGPASLVGRHSVLMKVKDRLFTEDNVALINPQTKPPVQEGKSRSRPLGRRSVLAGLVGGIIAVGTGVLVLDNPLMSAKTKGSRSSRAIAQANKTVPAQPIAGSSISWTGPQRIAGQGSLTTPALAVLNNMLYLAFVASDGSNQLCIISS